MSLLDPHRMLIAVVYMLIIQQVDGKHPLPSDRWWSDEGSST